MERHIIREKNRIQSDIRSVTNEIDREHERINYLLKTRPSYEQSEREKASIRIDNSREKLAKLESDLQNVETSVGRTKLQDEVTRNTLEIEKKRQKTILKKKDKLTKAEEQSRCSSINSKIVSADKNFRRLNREYNKHYSIFWKGIDTLPDYMKSNLASMPNNKGYIWRGIQFYGSQPLESHDIILFDNNKRVNTYPRMYKYTDYVTEMHEKRDRSYSLASSQPRVSKALNDKRLPPRSVIQNPPTNRYHSSEGKKNRYMKKAPRS